MKMRKLWNKVLKHLDKSVVNLGVLMKLCKICCQCKKSKWIKLAHAQIQPDGTCNWHCHKRMLETLNMLYKHLLTSRMCQMKLTSQLQVDLQDSISIVKSNCSSKAGSNASSSVSSAHRKALAERVALLSRQEAIKAKHALEQERTSEFKNGRNAT